MPRMPSYNAHNGIQTAWEYKLPLTPKTFTEWLYGVPTASTIFRAYLIKVSKISNVAPYSVSFLYSYTSKRDVLVLVSFLWGGGFSMFGFIIAHAKNSHVFLRVYWIYWLFWLFWEFWPPKSPLVERTKNFFCNELPPPLQRATPSSATNHPRFSMYYQ